MELPSVWLDRPEAAIGIYVETPAVSISPLALCPRKHVADTLENVTTIRINRMECDDHSVAICVAANCGPAGMKPAETFSLCAGHRTMHGLAAAAAFVLGLMVFICSRVIQSRGKLSLKVTIFVLPLITALLCIGLQQLNPYLQRRRTNSALKRPRLAIVGFNSLVTQAILRYQGGAIRLINCKFPDQFVVDVQKCELQLLELHNSPIAESTLLKWLQKSNIQFFQTSVALSPSFLEGCKQIKSMQRIYCVSDGNEPVFVDGLVILPLRSR